MRVTRRRSPVPKKTRTFFNKHVTFPVRDASPAELEKFWRTQAQEDLNPDYFWECAGPMNVAGRVTSLVINPNDPRMWFAGSATGGVWMSPDEGGGWCYSWSNFVNQNIGALLWATPKDAAPFLIAATGEANMSPDAYPGSGLYGSWDEGLTWGAQFNPGGKGALSIDEHVRTFPRRIGCLAQSPDGRTLALCSIYLDESMPAGLYLWDYGAPQPRPCEFWGRRSYNCHSAWFHPDDPRTIFAAIEPGGSDNGIWRSKDAGRSWEQLEDGLPPGDQFRRTTLAFAPRHPETIYALAANSSDRVLGVFRSDNGGDSWRVAGRPGDFPNERQTHYNNTIAVHPEDPKCVIWGGMQLWRTDDGGRSWRQLTSGRRGTPNYVHSDHHALLWPQPDTVISGNDGGVSVSRDGGETWTERSSGMATTMFYDLDVAPSNPMIFGGGTQDNGTLITGVPGCRNPDDFVPAIPGDGAWMVFDPNDANNVFASNTSFDIYHHRGRRPWTWGKGWKNIRPSRITDAERTERAYTVLAIGARGTATEGVWAGSERLWRMRRVDGARVDGRNWGVASHVFDQSPISAIEIGAVDPKVMYVGTTRGGIFRTEDGGETWSENLAGHDNPLRTVTSIQTHPGQKDTVVVTYATTGILRLGVELATGRDLPYGHVFRSENSGRRWVDIDDGSLPNVAYYAAAWETHPPHRLFVAGDVGVWAFSEWEVGPGIREKRWENFSGNLPNVVVSDLVYHPADRSLTAATYGRGIWRMITRVSPPTAVQAQGVRWDPFAPYLSLISPRDGNVFRTPRSTWRVKPYKGAAGYVFEWFIESQNRSVFETSPVPEKTLDFPFKGKGYWRAWAIFDGTRTGASLWRRFTFK
jgi:photosystem II stability/assembly factor-like uncharacterized protein